MRAPAASTDSLKLLAAGKADFSVVDIHDLGLARERGQDVVGVGAIVQRPLAAVIARAGVRRPRELEGRRVGVTGLPSDEAVLDSVVRADGGDPRQVRTTTIGFAAVPSLAAGKVDAVVTFWNAEGVALQAARRAHARVPRGPLRRAALPRAGAGNQARDAAVGPGLVRASCRPCAPAPAPPPPTCPRASAAVARRSQGDRAAHRRPAPRGGAGVRAAAGAAPSARWRAGPAFDTRFGILERRPDVDRAFVLD